MAYSSLEQLIELDLSADTQTDASDDRRAVLRRITDNFMVAPDRYGQRDTELFDLLLSRTMHNLDQQIRKLIAMSLVRSSAREEHVKLALSGLPSPNAQFLRRSVTQTQRDLVVWLQEKAPTSEGKGDTTLSDGNSLTLPSFLTDCAYRYIAGSYIQDLSLKLGKDRTKLISRTTDRGRDMIVLSAIEKGRDEVVTARRTVRDWVRRQTISDEILSELLEARAMTEFILTLSELFKIDVATTIRILNDNSFETLAITAKANSVRRSTFAKTIFGFRHRRTDQVQAERVLGLYDKLTIESAERAIRFWRLRVANQYGGTAEHTAVTPDPQPKISEQEKAQSLPASTFSKKQSA